MMLKSLIDSLGIDPEAIKTQVETFGSNINERVQTIEQKMDLIISLLQELRRDNSDFLPAGEGATLALTAGSAGENFTAHNQ